jgi:hypothetical protein
LVLQYTLVRDVVLFVVIMVGVFAILFLINVFIDWVSQRER